MTPGEHYARAEKLLADLAKIDEEVKRVDGVVTEQQAEYVKATRRYLLALAQVHATLASSTEIVRVRTAPSTFVMQQDVRAGQKVETDPETGLLRIAR